MKSAVTPWSPTLGLAHRPKLGSVGTVSIGHTNVSPLRRMGVPSADTPSEKVGPILLSVTTKAYPPASEVAPLVALMALLGYAIVELTMVAVPVPFAPSTAIPAHSCGGSVVGQLWAKTDGQSLRPTELSRTLVKVFCPALLASRIPPASVIPPSLTLTTSLSLTVSVWPFAFRDPLMK